MKLSPHFDSDELSCPHCNRCEIKASALLKLEELRSAVGLPLKVGSGYRCEAHNKAIGGEQGSKHCEGIAFDVYCPAGITLQAFYKLANKIFATGGVGVYPKGKGQNTDFIHVDDRQAPKPARWSRINGKYLGVNEAWKA